MTNHEAAHRVRKGTPRVPDRLEAPQQAPPECIRLDAGEPVYTEVRFG